MPFTFAHPAAIMPIKNKWKDKFCLTGLVLGSMAPDYEYFINFRPSSVYGHNFLGFFILNLPLCYILAYIFHYIIKKPLLLHLPRPFDGWFAKTAHQSWKLNSVKQVMIFGYSALLGMLTHVFWDSFTHIDGMMVEFMPVLSAKLFIFDYTLPIYKILQHGSSILGMMFILVHLYRMKREKSVVQPVSTVKKVSFFTSIFLIALIVILGVICLGYQGIASIGVYVVTSINGVFFGVLLTALMSRIGRLELKHQK